MVNLIIGGNDVSGKVTKYEETPKKIEDSVNSFITADGKTHKCLLPSKVTITASLEDLSDSEKASITTALTSDTVSITYGGNTGTFFGDSTPSTICYTDGNVNHWDIDFTLEEV